MTKILIISPEAWDSHFVSKHHYACELARMGHDVLFLDPPERSEIQITTVFQEDVGRVRVVRGGRVAPGLQYMASRLRRILESRWLERLERIAGGRIEIVWLFENSRFYDMRFAGDRLKIYHQVDLNQDFHPETAAETADIVIAVSAPIEARLAELGRKVVRITHGCPPTQSVEESEEITRVFRRFRVNAVLTGNISIPYLDTSLLSDLVHAHEDVGFHFIGRYDLGKGLHAAVQKRDNATFWGFQSPSLLSGFLRHADLLLVPYLSQHHLEQLANPHKIMEYLAAGSCILATHTLEYESRPELIEMALDRESFKNRFAVITSDPSAWNSLDRIAIRQSFAADNSYKKQIQRISLALGDRGQLIC